MSSRSIRRARERELRRAQGRSARRVRQLGVGAGGVLAAALFAAPAGADAATFTVTKTADTNDSACTVGDCSLREAIDAANANGTDDVINFASGVTGTSTLNFGHMDIRNEGLEIQGPGAGQLTIDGADSDRIFKLFGFDTAGEQVVISGLTLVDGNGLPSPFSGDGGAILSLDGSVFGEQGFDFGDPADLTVADSVIAGSIGERGGAIAVETIDSASSGGLTVRNSTIDGNEAVVGGGAFVTQTGQEVTIDASTFSNNSAFQPQEAAPADAATGAPGFTRDGDGGGLMVERGNGTVLVQNSTFAGNHADLAGGGIRFVVNAGNPRIVTNSTIAGNDAGEGGGISTSLEQEVSPPPDGGTGGLAQGQLELSSDVIAGNTAIDESDDSDGPDVRSNNVLVTAGFSLLEVPTGATIADDPAGSNITGQDPQLGALGANGGPTETMLPATTSPAIDAGVANSLATEQRGLGRTVDLPNPNASGSDATDMGAVELQPDTAPGPRQERCLGEPVLVKRGGSGGEKIEGTPERDGVFAHGGNDDVLGLGDRDCLFGGGGNDELDGGPDDDFVNGDPDNDKVEGSGGRDDVRGQHGNDKVFGGPGGDRRVAGGAGNDKVFGGDGDDTLIKGDGGDDVLDLGDGNDFVHAGGGKDTIKAADGQVDTIICGAGHDVAFVDAGDTVNRDCNTVHVVD